MDFKKLLLMVTPPQLRVPTMRGILNPIGETIQSFYQRFVSYSDESKRKARINGQKLVLESALNDRFDPVGRKWKILHQAPVSLYIYDDPVNDPITYTYDSDPLYVYFDNERFLSFGYDFALVRVVEYTEDEVPEWYDGTALEYMTELGGFMRDFIDTYRPFGKTYYIE